jgi:hypothetical protein
MTERRIASHPDDPSAPFEDRLMLALGMWPSYRAELGDEAVIAAAVILRGDAHRYPMVCEDWGTATGLVESLRAELQDLRAFSLAHHSDQDSAVWLHALISDIPWRIADILDRGEDA